MVLTVGSVVFRPEDGTVWLGTGEAPTSHGRFEPFSLRTMDHAPEMGSFCPGDAIDAKSRDAFEHYRRAYMAYVDRDDVAAARGEMALACHTAPKQSAYHAVAGLMALQDGDARDAIRLFDTAAGLDHPDEERRSAFQLWRGRALDVDGQRKEAVQAYRAALSGKADAAVFEAARKGVRKPYRAAEARRLHIEMSLGDVMVP
jgi:tetratricopeptide (TPR) repeat protein